MLWTAGADGAAGAATFFVAGAAGVAAPVAAAGAATFLVAAVAFVVAAAF